MAGLGDIDHFVESAQTRVAEALVGLPYGRAERVEVHARIEPGVESLHDREVTVAQNGKVESGLAVGAALVDEVELADVMFRADGLGAPGRQMNIRAKQQVRG